ncbi:MAG TPA: hypothetical protein VKQ05_11845 [Gemmatimonadales bacterium]|nr:hypothetical protein [Gemmatimonadales bacterium]
MRAVIFTLAAVFTAPLAAQGGGCGDTKFPPQLPAPSALIDSAHAVADLAAFAGAKPMVFSLVFNKGDSVPHVRALDNNDAAAATALYNYIRHQPPADLWAIRLRVTGGTTPSLTLERSQYCAPRPLSGEGGMQSGGSGQSIGGSPQPSGGREHTLLRTGPDATMGKARSTEFEALVGLDGRVIVARLLRPTGNADVDADAARQLQQQRFKPALLDDEPVAALYRSGGQSPRP